MARLRPVLSFILIPAVFCCLWICCISRSVRPTLGFVVVTSSSSSLSKTNPAGGRRRILSSPTTRRCRQRRQRRNIVPWGLSSSSNNYNDFNNFDDDNDDGDSDNNSNDDDDDHDSPLNALRSLLEASWNEKYMGRVPSDPEAAADEAHAAIMKAVDHQRNQGRSGIFFVDLLLPSYDVSQGGEKMYDEVLAVEYCILLAERLDGKSEILVKNDKTKNIVERVLTARENMNAVPVVAEDDEEDDDDDDDDDDEFIIETSSSLDVDSFRQSLMSQWEGGGDSNVEEQDAITDEPQQSPPQQSGSEGYRRTDDVRPLTTNNNNNNKNSNKKYRLASMLGGVEILSNGPEMPPQVIDAVRRNAMAKEDEESIIILSPISQQELVAVRALAAKYTKNKKIILVNCRFDPMPLELLEGETVYSVFPLVARHEVTRTTATKDQYDTIDVMKDINKMNDGDDGDDDDDDSSSTPPPRVVILRRYPYDWEVFVDLGNGFELAASTPVTPENKRGLPKEWVGESIQSYLDSLSRSR